MQLRYTPVYSRFDLKYVSAQVLIQYLEHYGLEDLHPPESLHITTVFSRSPCFYEPRFVAHPMANPYQFKILGDQLVILVESHAAEESWKKAVTSGASWDFPQYQPHISISSNISQNFEDIKIEDYGYIGLQEEIAQELILN